MSWGCDNKSVKGSKLYPCSFCTRILISEKKFATHLKKCHNSEYHKKCLFCDENFEISSDNGNAFSIHMKNMHSSNKESIEYQQLSKEFGESFENYCEKCGKIFHSRGNWNYHRKNKHGSKESKIPETCHICGKGYKNIKSHIDAFHNFESTTCSECGATLKNKTYLYAHMRIHNYQNAFKCEVCGKEFRVKKNLSEHNLVVHMKDKRIKCEYCGRGFPRKNKLKSHILSVHTSKDEKPLSCNKCDYRCSRRDSMRFHLQNNHKIK